MCESPWEVMPGVASFPVGGVPQVRHLARTLGCRLQATCRVMSTCWSETTFRGKVISLSFKASQAFMNVLPLWWIRSNSAKVRHLSLSSAAPCTLAWPCAISLYWSSCYKQCVKDTRNCPEKAMKISHFNTNQSAPSIYIMIELCYFSLDQWEIRIHLLWGKSFNIPLHCDPHLNQTKWLIFNELLPLTIPGVLIIIIIVFDIFMVIIILLCSYQYHTRMSISRTGPTILIIIVITITITLKEPNVNVRSRTREVATRAQRGGQDCRVS